MTFIQGVERSTRLNGIEHTKVTVVGFVTDGVDVRAVVVDRYGRFDTERLDHLKLPPKPPRQTIRG